MLTGTYQNIVVVYLEIKINHTKQVNFQKKENQIIYKDNLSLILQSKNLTSQQIGKQIVKTLQLLAKETIGIDKCNNLLTNIEIDNITLTKRKIKVEIDNSKNDI